MKKMRLHIYIVLGIFLVGFILGTFLDLKLTEAIFSKGNGFGIFMSAVGTIPGYMILAMLGGGFLALAMHKDYKVGYKVVLYVLTVACAGCAIFFTGREFFGENGFYNPDIKWVGYFIVLPIAIGCTFLGYWITKKSNTPYLWLIYAILAFCIFMALVPGVTLLKSVFHRPRYRELVSGGFIEFHPWYDRCSNYKDYIALGFSKEEFKSFPSGHAGASAVFMLATIALPLLNKKYEKITLPLFYGGFAWCLFISFTRILVGAHFLSDVSMGGILTSLFMLIANEAIIYSNKKLKFVEE